MNNPSRWISVGDFIDLYYKLWHKGYYNYFRKFNFSGHSRTISKWDATVSSSDFWIIPQVRKRWNEKCTGNPDLEYEDYVVAKYLINKSNLRLLSVGCGTGSRERKFAKYPVFSSVEGIDLAPQQISEAENLASKASLNNISYHTGDFLTYSFKPESYDVILFNSSLHHFDHIDDLLQKKVLPLLKNDGQLIIFEYVGPDRLQWTKAQLNFANRLLRELPKKYKTRFNSSAVKKRIYRPGLLRMMLVDPSEAVDSSSIAPALHKHFTLLEEQKVGWDITHILLKDIAHNFLDESPETLKWLNHLFEQEDRFIGEHQTSDAIFGVYRKKS